MKLVGILIIAAIVLIDALCVLVVLGGNNLDEDQRGYLAASLDGRGEEFARDAGTTAVRFEDGINAAAMDTVGDQIIEDGNVFDEYADDVRRILAAHPVEIG